MPIKPENRSKYPADWQKIRQRILDRAENKCERCGRPNGLYVMRFSGGNWIAPETGEAFSDSGESLGRIRMSEWPAGKITKTVLTIAHLDHDPTNNADDNLEALCQWHHLTHDKEHHAANARETRRTKNGQGVFQFESASDASAKD